MSGRKKSKSKKIELELKSLTKEAPCLSVEEASAPMTTRSKAGTYDSLSLNDFIFLNVGGVQHITTLSTLLVEPDSNLAKWFTDPALYPKKDSTGSFFIDRDGKIFRHILNYLRGYSVCIDPSLIHQLLWELEFYGIRGLQKLVGLHQETPGLFQIGPGVSADRTGIRSAYAVSVIGDDWLSTGIHTQKFRIEKRDFIGIGVLSSECKDRGSDFGLSKNCGAYYQNGCISQAFMGFQKWDSQKPFSEGDRISVTINFHERKIHFFRNEMVVDFIQIPDGLNNLELQFAVVLKWPAQVEAIVEENSPLV